MLVLIDSIYITHTAYLAGWDLEDIFKGTLFKKSATTSRIPKDGSFAMLDWDFRSVEGRGLIPTWKKHLQIVKSFKPETVMSPDLWIDNWKFAYSKYKALTRICDRVVMPVHVPPKRSGLDLAWPMGVWTNDNVAVWEVADDVKHLLGGNPHAQLEMSNYFPNLRSIDGNQIYVVALRFGKYWRGRWIKPNPRWSTEECFRESVRNISDSWNSI